MSSSAFCRISSEKFTSKGLFGETGVRNSSPFGASNNGQGRNRTADTQIFSLLLYQLSYLAAFRIKSRDLPRDMSACRICRRCKPLCDNYLAWW